MATDVQVVLAYRNLGCPHRLASFKYVHRYYRGLGFEVVVEHGTDDDTFTRASGINAGVRKATARVIVQSDPDSLAPPANLEEAIALAREADGVVAPFDRHLYLNLAATRQVLDGRHLDTLGPGDCEYHGSGGVGNALVFSRRTWETCGGFDERFGLWGGDDSAFVHAADAYTQPLRRVPGDVVHLWHPRLPASNPETIEYVDQFVLVAEYRDAAELGPEAVRDYVESR